MAGIYIHIPFCRQACHYCDFHFSTNLSRQQEMIEAICQEIGQRATYANEMIQTIYLGGGTPSLLSPYQLKLLFEKIDENFSVSPEAEITLEANPEDLSSKNLEAMKSAGINRLSIGIQTFSTAKLKWMNRIHTVEEAEKGFRKSREAGFQNISLDLIYALPGRGLADWKEDLKRATELQPEHISLYGLTIEPQTVFGKQKTRGDFKEVEEESAADQYLVSIDFLTQSGYLQYEVANFSKEGFQSQHNSSYWARDKYLGVGPGAHSYDGKSRQFNVRNNAKYITALNGSNPYFELEVLSKTQLMNESILTQLRTKKGIDLEKFNYDFDFDLAERHQKTLHKLAADGLLTVNQYASLTAKGFLLADEIALKLFFEE